MVNESIVYVDVTIKPAAGPAVVCTSLRWGVPARTVDIEG